MLFKVSNVLKEHDLNRFIDFDLMSQDVFNTVKKLTSFIGESFTFPGDTESLTGESSTKNVMIRN